MKTKTAIILLAAFLGSTPLVAMNGQAQIPSTTRGYEGQLPAHIEVKYVIPAALTSLSLSLYAGYKAATTVGIAAGIALAEIAGSYPVIAIVAPSVIPVLVGTAAAITCGAITLHVADKIIRRLTDDY